MLDKKHKLLELKTSALVDSLFIGNYKTNLKGRCIEFIDYKEYDFSDNVKNIDFLRSDLEGKTLVKLYEEERELSVYFLVDLNSSFFESGLENNKIDIVYEILYLIGLSAIKSGDKVGAFIFDKNKQKINLAKKGKQNFVNIINDVYNYNIENDLKYGFFNHFRRKKSRYIGNDSKNFGLSYFNGLKIKNSLVFYITDKLDIESKQLRILGTKNDLIVCNIFNSFENNLEGNGISIVNNNDNNLFLDLDNEKKKNEYRDLRLKKINELKKIVFRNGGRYLLLDETKNVYKEFYKLFKI